MSFRRIGTAIRTVIAFGVMLASSALPGRSDFVGQDLTFTFTAWPPYETLFEVLGLPALGESFNLSDYGFGLGVDLSGANLTLFEEPPASQTSYGTAGYVLELEDLSVSEQIIAGVIVDTSTDVPSFDASRISSNNEDVYIDMDGITLLSGEQISLDFSFEGNSLLVPEPRLFWLMTVVVGTLFGVGVYRQRRRKQVTDYIWFSASLLRRAHD